MSNYAQVTCDPNEVNLQEGRGAQVVVFVSGVYYSGDKEQSSAAVILTANSNALAPGKMKVK